MKEALQIETQLKEPRSRLESVGPGLITAATGVGAGDLVAALVAGAAFGMTFAWAIVLGAILKYYINEGIGRWQLATGKTLIEGWHSMGKWITGYFGVYSIIFGLVYGAAIASSCALAMRAMFPILPFWVWAVIHSIAGFILVITNRYAVFEKLMTILVGVMFVTIVGTAVMTVPSLTSLSIGLVPRIPEGSFINVLALVGGVGGSISMISYGYWIKEKGWNGKAWIPFMRFDSKIAYTVTAIFTLSVLVVGAEFLFNTGIKLSGEQGLISLADLLGKEFGTPARWLFLIGFWSASFTSLLGPWNGLPYLFADFLYTIQDKKDAHPSLEKSPAYLAYLFLLTFPPMLLLFIGKPVGLIITYGVLGATFMPFLAISLYLLLNSKTIDSSFKNRWHHNMMIAVCILLFLYLSVSELSILFG